MTNKGILKLPILFILLLALIASCGKDDTPTDDTPVSETPTDDDPGDDDSDDDDTGANTPPIVDDAEFSVDENLAPGSLIGEIVAEDAEQTVLTYAIEAGDDASLFDVDDKGNLTLAADQNLDYESATSHQITVVVGDGSVTVKGDVTINVNDINEAPQLLTDVSTIQVVESIDDTAVIVDLDATDPEDDKFFFA
ncbi:MAG: cadherin repeat domain-containing protein, partial [Bacteroidota bacterium]